MWFFSKDRVVSYVPAVNLLVMIAVSAAPLGADLSCVDDVDGMIKRRRLPKHRHHPARDSN